MRTHEEQVQEAKTELLNYIKHGQIGVIVRSVSTTGLSRKMSFVAYDESEKRFVNLTGYVALVLDYTPILSTLGDTAINVKGYGMDMVHDIVHRVTRALGADTISYRVL